MKSTFSRAARAAKFMPAVGWIILYLFTTLFVCLAPLCKTQLVDVWEATHAKLTLCFLTITCRRTLSVTKVAPSFRWCVINLFVTYLIGLFVMSQRVWPWRFLVSTHEAAWFLSSSKLRDCWEDELFANGKRNTPRPSLLKTDRKHVSEKQFQSKA